MFGWALGSTQMIQNAALLVGPRGLGGDPCDWIGKGCGTEPPVLSAVR